MNKFEIVFGDTVLAVSQGARVCDHFNPSRNIAHFHIDSEVHIVFDGSVTMELNGESTELSAGDICIVGSNVSHYYKSHSESFDKTSLTFSIIRNRDDRGDFSEYDYYSGIFGSVKGYVIIKDEELMKIALEIMSLKSSDITEHIYQALYAVFFIKLAWAVQNRLSADTQIGLSDGRAHKDDYGEKSVIEDFFHTRYNENATIEELSRVLYKSVPQTHRIVKRYFGESFKRILIRQRIEHACMLLKRSRASLSMIAVATGYSSYNGFSSAFKKYTGKTPERYRADYEAEIDRGD